MQFLGLEKSFENFFSKNCPYTFHKNLHNQPTPQVAPEGTQWHQNRMSEKRVRET